MSPGRFGLIIASYQYEDSGLRRLLAPARDAEALAAVLSDPQVGGFEVETVINLPSHEVTRRIERFFADRHRDDLLLLYFSGHGLKDSRGRLFLAMSNTERRVLNSTAVSAAFVREALEQSRSRQNVLLLDCCYSGAFAKGATPKADTSSVQTQDRFGAAGSVVLTASDSLQYSFEDDGLSGSGVESVFTRVLVEGLRSGEADRGLDGDVDLDELYDYIYDRVAKERPEQKPGKWAWEIHGRIVIARNPRWAMPTRIQQALDSPFPGMRLGAVEELVHLARVGNDDVAARARQALEQLTNDDSKNVCHAAIAALEQTRAEAEASQRVTEEPEARAEPQVKQPAAAEVPPSPAPEPKPTAGEERRASRVRHVVTARRSDRHSASAGVLRRLVSSLARKARTRAGTALASLASAGIASAVVVGLLLSRSSQGVIVPRVTGDQATVTAALENVGLTVHSVELYADAPRGQVVRTEPAADARVGRHSTITLYVSRGPQPVVPQVSGPAAAAEAKLNKAGFTVHKVSEPNAKVPIKSVTRTMPPAGAKVDYGSVVTLYISTGNAKVQIPNVVGMSQLEADALIQKARLVVSHIRDYSGSFPYGYVIGTSPTGGTTVSVGATVEEDVSLGTQQQSGPTSPAPATAPPPEPTIPLVPTDTSPHPSAASPGAPPLRGAGRL